MILLHDNPYSYRLLWAYHDHFAILYTDSTLVVLKSDISPSISLQTLQQIRQHTTIDLNRAIIDLRYDKPVIIPAPISL